MVVDHKELGVTDRLVISDKEKSAVLKLDGPRRYSYAVKRIVDWESAWGLRQEDGWALFTDDDGRTCFPIWPAREYAEACAINKWSGYVADEIPLQDILNILPKMLCEDDILIAVFATPSGQGVVVSPDQLRHDLELECEKYE